ncbi:MAG: hypothetical protein ABI990_08150 [Actinomycetota bacterium]
MKTFIALLALLILFAAAPAAGAGGPPQYAAQGGMGITTSKGDRYVALRLPGGTTMLAFVSSDGSVWNGPIFRGDWGIPMITYRDAGGLSLDGHTLVLQSAVTGPTTSFIVLDTRRYRVKRRFTLRGSYSFDAWSPDASRLYLIDRVDTTNLSRYIVKAYDLTTNRLLPGRIADRTQKGWVMQGDAATRTTSVDGRWAYTLYMNQGGTPFIHALDTVRGVAHCIGIPWKSVDQSGLQNVVLTLHGDRLAVHWRSGRQWLDVNTASWRVSPASASTFPWAWLGFAAVPLLLFLVWRRRPRSAGTFLAREA